MTAQGTGRIAVTGATGALGSRVAGLLADRGVSPLLVVRRPDAAPDLPGAEVRGPATYDDGAAMRRALDGADTVVLVSGSPTGRRLEEHATVIEAARSAGVTRVLYVSLLGAGPVATYRNARDHWLTEQFIIGSGLSYTIFRAGFYAATPAALADEELVIAGPGGDGQVAFVTHDDIAAVISEVAAAPRPAYDGAVLEITGPELLTLDEVVERIAAATGRPYRYRPENLTEAFARRWRMGIGGNQIESWISWYQAIARGELAARTNVVAAVTGRAASPVEDAGWWPDPGTAF